MSQDDRAWCEDYAAVVEFGAYLAQEFGDADALQAYYEKPWKWTPERTRWLAALAAGNDSPELGDLEEPAPDTEPSP